MEHSLRRNSLHLTEPKTHDTVATSSCYFKLSSVTYFEPRQSYIMSLTSTHLAYFTSVQHFLWLRTKPVLVWYVGRVLKNNNWW